MIAQITPFGESVEGQASPFWAREVRFSPRESPGQAQAEVLAEVLEVRLPCDGSQSLWSFNRQVGMEPSHTGMFHTGLAHMVLSQARFEHAHLEMELGVVTSGRWRVQSGAANGACDLELEAGGVWLCGVGEAHRVEALSPGARAVQWLFYPGDAGALFLPEASGFDWFSPFMVAPAQRPRLDEGGRQSALELAARLLEIFPHSDAVARLRVRLLSLELLLLLQRAWRAPVSMPDVPLCALAPAFALVLGSRQNVSVRAAARACGLGLETFSQHFRALTRLSFPQWALQHRLNGAALLLEATDWPLKAIAAHWGFADASHLHRCFRRHYALSPAQFRQARREGGAL